MAGSMRDCVGNCQTSENHDVYDEDTWMPPSASEVKVMQARRERQDKISRLLGEYLLKGYKMLGSTCPDCDTILMRTKQGVDYCVACSELESDGDVKDNPALSSEAARCQVRETEIHQQRLQSAAAAATTSATSAVSTTDAKTSANHHVPVQSSISPASHPISMATTTTAPLLGVGPSGDEDRVLSSAVAALHERLAWATSELRREPISIETTIQLCTLITSCANALSALGQLNVRCRTESM